MRRSTVCSRPGRRSSADKQWLEQLAQKKKKKVNDSTTYGLPKCYDWLIFPPIFRQRKINYFWVCQETTRHLKIKLKLWIHRIEGGKISVFSENVCVRNKEYIRCINYRTPFLNILQHVSILYLHSFQQLDRAKSFTGCEVSFRCQSCMFIVKQIALLNS